MKSKICSIDVCASLKALKNTNQQNTNLFIANKKVSQIRLGSENCLGCCDTSSQVMVEKTIPSCKRVGQWLRRPSQVASDASN